MNFLIALLIAQSWWGGTSTTPVGCAALSPAPTFCLPVTDNASGCYSSLTATTGQSLTLTNGGALLIDSAFGPATVVKCASSSQIRINSSYGVLFETGSNHGNWVLHSEDFGSWTASNTTVTTDTTTAPDGTSTADTLTSTVNGGYVESAASSTNSGVANAMTVYAKTTSGTQSFAIQMWDATSAGQVSVSSYTATTEWSRFGTSSATTTAGHNLTLRIYPGGTASTGTIVAWGAQAESASAGGYAVQYSYMPTTTVAVSQSGPDTVSTTSNPWSDYTTDWSVSFDYTPFFALNSGTVNMILLNSKNAANSNNQTEFLITNTSSFFQVQLRNSAGTLTNCNFNPQTNFTPVPNTYSNATLTTTAHIRVTYTAATNTLQGYAGGYRAGPPCTPANKPSAVPDHLYIGSDNSSQPAMGYIKNLCIDKTSTSKCQ